MSERPRLEVADYIGRPRDTKVENDLADRLRAGSPDDAFDFIWEYLDHDQVVGLSLANRVLRDPARFSQILARGLRQADAYWIQFWFEACIPRIGAKRAFELLRAAVNEDAEVGRRVMYYARSILIRADPSLRAALDELKAAL